MSELKIIRYVQHQFRQKPEYGFPYIDQDTTDYFPYESVYVKTLEEAQQYMRDTLSDFTKIYPDAMCDRESCIHFLITKSSLRVIISGFIDDEESPNMYHDYTYMYSAVYIEECE